MQKVIHKWDPEPLNPEPLNASRSAIAFMYNFGEMPLFADQPCDGLVEHHRKPLGTAPHHLPHDLKLIFEVENRELEFNGLP